MERRSLLKGSAAFVAGAIAAPFVSRANAADSIELLVTHCNPGHDAFHAQITDEFRKRHPNISIRYTNSPPGYEDGHQLLLRQAMTNQLPDIYYSGFHLMPPLARQLRQRNQVVSLDKFMAAEGDAWVKANYSERILNLSRVDGQQMAMAFNTSTPIAYYNADLVKRAGGDPDNFPATWDGIIELAAKISALGNGVDGLFHPVHTQTDDWLWQSLVFQNGGDLMDASDTKVAFGDASGLEALKLARRFVKDGKQQMNEMQQGAQQFFGGKTGIIFQSTASLKGTVDSVGSNFTLRTAKNPINDKVKGGLPTGGNGAMILTRDEAKQKAAWEFLKWVSGPEAQTIAVLFSGYMPTNIRAQEKEFLGAFYEKNPNWLTSVNQIPVARKWYGYPGTNSQRIIKVQKEIVGTVMRGDLAVEAGLQQMVEQTQALLPKV